MSSEMKVGLRYNLLTLQALPQGDIYCGASSQDDFILNYSLSKSSKISSQILHFLPVRLAGYETINVTLV